MSPKSNAWLRFETPLDGDRGALGGYRGVVKPASDRTRAARA